MLLSELWGGSESRGLTGEQIYKLNKLTSPNEKTQHKAPLTLAPGLWLVSKALAFLLVSTISVA